VLEQFQLSKEIGLAVGEFLPRRLVVRRGTPNGCCDVEVS